MLHADQVVVATGPFQTPRLPAIARQLAGGVTQIHSARLPRRPTCPPRRVLVVGGGNTGFQIAEELAGSRDVHLAVGSRQTPPPQRILGRDLFRFIEATGLMSATVTSRIGQRMEDRETLIGSSPLCRAQGRHHDPRPRNRRRRLDRHRSRTADASMSTP